MNELDVTHVQYLRTELARGRAEVIRLTAEQLERAERLKVLQLAVKSIEEQLRKAVLT